MCVVPVHVYVCVSVYVCAYMYVYMCVPMCVCMYMGMCMCASMCMCVYEWVCVYLCVYNEYVEKKKEMHAERLMRDMEVIGLQHLPGVMKLVWLPQHLVR